MNDKTWNEFLKQNTENAEPREIQRKKLLDDIIKVVKDTEEEIVFIGSEYHKKCAKLTAYENIEELIKDYERKDRKKCPLEK
jgi:hypothetical protein